MIIFLFLLVSCSRYKYPPHITYAGIESLYDEAVWWFFISNYDKQHTSMATHREIELIFSDHLYSSLSMKENNKEIIIILPDNITGQEKILLQTDTINIRFRVLKDTGEVVSYPRFNKFIFYKKNQKFFFQKRVLYTRDLSPDTCIQYYEYPNCPINQFRSDSLNFVEYIKDHLYSDSLNIDLKYQLKQRGFYSNWWEW